MTWISKDLTLDLLAIGIDAMQRTFDRIKQEPNELNWPPTTGEPAPAAAPPTVAEEPTTPDTAKGTPQHAEESAAGDGQNLLVEAKTLLQPISRNGGREWITSDLLPRFGVDKLSDVPTDKLPELIDIVKQKGNAA